MSFRQVWLFTVLADWGMTRNSSLWNLTVYPMSSLKIGKVNGQDLKDGEWGV